PVHPARQPRPPGPPDGRRRRAPGRHRRPRLRSLDPRGVARSPGLRLAGAPPGRLARAPRRLAGDPLRAQSPRGRPVAPLFALRTPGLGWIGAGKPPKSAGNRVAGGAEMTIL